VLGTGWGWGQSLEWWQDTTEHLVTVTPMLFIARGGDTPRDWDQTPFRKTRETAVGDW